MEQKVEVIESWTPDTYELWVDNVLVRKDDNHYGSTPFKIYPDLKFIIHSYMDERSY